MVKGRTPWVDTEAKDYLLWLRSIVGPEPLLEGIAAVCAVLRPNTDSGNAVTEILLGKRGDNGKWSIPSGAKQANESVKEAAIRELHEETGLEICAADMKLIVEYSDEKQIHSYPNGDIRYTKIVYIASLESCRGELRPADGENTELKFFDLNHLPENCSGSTRRIVSGLKNDLGRVLSFIWQD